MKKNKTMRLIAIALLIAMIALILVSGTYAKYTSSTTGTASARVAKWSITFGDEDIMASNTFTFNLFDTIKDTDGSTETDVKSANSDKVIAPGTTGNFEVQLTNASEVSAEYAIDYTVVNDNNIPVEFSTDGTNWSSTLEDVTATTIAAGTPTTIKIQWRWAYEVQDAGSDPATYSQRDEQDTTLGKAGSATLQVTAKVTATQVD